MTTPASTHTIATTVSGVMTAPGCSRSTSTELSRFPNSEVIETSSTPKWLTVADVTPMNTMPSAPPMSSHAWPGSSGSPVTRAPSSHARPEQPSRKTDPTRKLTVVAVSEDAEAARTRPLSADCTEVIAPASSGTRGAHSGIPREKPPTDTSTTPTRTTAVPASRRALSAVRPLGGRSVPSTTIAPSS
jgi:hypothetical protein